MVLELSLIWSYLLWGEFNTFSAANAIKNFLIFHSTRYTLVLGGQRQYRMRSLPNTSTYDQQWESNPRPSDLVQCPIHLATYSHYPIVPNQRKIIHICNSCLYNIISSEENSAHFLQANAINNFPIFHSTKYPYCCVGRGSMGWEVCPTLLHMTNSGNWTPDLILSNTGSTWPHAPIIPLSQIRGKIIHICSSSHSNANPFGPLDHTHPHMQLIHTRAH